MATWSLNAPTSLNWEGQSEKKRRKKEKLEIRKMEKGERKWRQKKGVGYERGRGKRGKKRWRQMVQTVVQEETREKRNEEG